MYKNLLIALLLLLHFTSVEATEDQLYFIIYGDKHKTEETYEIKNELIDEFEDLVKGLDPSDYAKAIEDNLCCENARFEKDTLVVVVGNGQGKVLKGKLKANYCEIGKDELKTEFFFKKIWQKGTS